MIAIGTLDFLIADSRPLDPTPHPQNYFKLEFDYLELLGQKNIHTLTVNYIQLRCVADTQDCIVCSMIRASSLHYLLGSEP